MVRISQLTAVAIQPIYLIKIVRLGGERTLSMVRISSRCCRRFDTNPRPLRNTNEAPPTSRPRKTIPVQRYLLGLGSGVAAWWWHQGNVQVQPVECFAVFCSHTSDTFDSCFPVNAPSDISLPISCGSLTTPRK
jgi:hypothetical protein